MCECTTISEGALYNLISTSYFLCNLVPKPRMIKRYFGVVCLLALLVSCEEEVREKDLTTDKNKVTSDSIVNESLDSVQPILQFEKRLDTIQIPGDQVKVDSILIDTLINSEASEFPEEIKYFESEWDDPNYVGTPCEYLNGECVRHVHKQNVDPPN